MAAVMAVSAAVSASAYSVTAANASNLTLAYATASNTSSHFNAGGYVIREAGITDYPEFDANTGYKTLTYKYNVSDGTILGIIKASSDAQAQTAATTTPHSLMSL